MAHVSRAARPSYWVSLPPVRLRKAVIDSASRDPDIQGMRRFYEQLAAEPCVSATAIQTVCSKGYDGFAIALVTEAQAARER